MPTRSLGGAGMDRKMQGPMAPASGALNFPSENEQADSPINSLERSNHFFR